MRNPFILITLLFSIFLSGQNVKDVHIEEFDLENGLHVILHEDINEPNVIVGVKYHVGSKNEIKNRTGFAHFYEHLLFHGTKNIPQGEFENVIMNAGGYCNAYTSYDVTYYYQLLPAHEYKLGLWVEAERMLHPQITVEGINREREIVKEEKRMRYDSKPLGNSYFDLMEALYSYETYGHNMIGSMEDLNAASKDDFQDFFKTYYVPNNACLVLSGNIDIKETKKWVKHYFKDIPKGEKIKRPKKFEKLTGVTKRLDKTVKGLKEESLVLGFPIISDKHPDAPAMQMLVSILSGDSNYSYFENEIKEKNDTIINSINASADFWENVGSLRIKGMMKKEGSEEYFIQKVEEQLERLKNEPIDEILLEQVKRKFESSYVDLFFHAETFADKVSSYHHLNNGASNIRKITENFKNVTSEDIQRVAKKYLTNNKRVLIVYHPE